jgi:hypothetical protein
MSPVWGASLGGTSKAIGHPSFVWMPFREAGYTTDAWRAYIIMIVENYSRAVVASLLSRIRDLQAYLMVLYAAIRQHGAHKKLRLRLWDHLSW